MAGIKRKRDVELATLQQSLTSLHSDDATALAASELPSSSFLSIDLASTALKTLHHALDNAELELEQVLTQDKQAVAGFSAALRFSIAVCSFQPSKTLGNSSTGLKRSIYGLFAQLSSQIAPSALAGPVAFPARPVQGALHAQCDGPAPCSRAWQQCTSNLCTQAALLRHARCHGGRLGSSGAQGVGHPCSGQQGTPIFILEAV